MYLVGLTGGIASGKSTVARQLVNLGAVLIDADALSREAVLPGSVGLAAVKAAFGDNAVAADGTMDRAAVGAVVFADSDKRAELEGIIHPYVQKRTAELIAEAAAADPRSVVVYDIPLLVETKRNLPFDRIVVCAAPAAVRAERLVALRGLDSAEADRRIAAQATEEERAAVADTIINTNLTLDETTDQVNALWAAIGLEQEGLSSEPNGANDVEAASDHAGSNEAAGKTDATGTTNAGEATGSGTSATTAAPHAGENTSSGHAATKPSR